DLAKLDVTRAQGQQSIDQQQAQADGFASQLRAAQDSLATLTGSSLGGSTITQVPNIGDTVDRGQPIYWLDRQPVPLLIADQSAYRAFQPGMAPGPDVRALQDNLNALGLGEGLAVDGDYDSATQAAVARLQAKLGGASTGTLPLGTVMFLPTPA